MQIQLKQSEIVAALKAYVVNQGISLAGKTVEIAFTAGRKEAGISADISIEDAGVPALDSDESEAKPRPALSVVPNDAKPEVTPETPAGDSPIGGEPVAAAAQAPAGKSLFG